MFGLMMDIGIDLGTDNVLVYEKKKGIVLREPSVVAVDRDTNRVLAIGEEARRMLGRTPGNIVAVRPMRDGVIADFEITEMMIRYFIEKVVGHHFIFRPRIMICISSGITKVEQRAVREAVEQAGAARAQLIDEPMAAAIGAGLPVSEAAGSMIVDIGGGTTEMAVISLGGIVLSDSMRIGGDKFDEAIIDYVHRKFNVLIGSQTAEEVKIKVAAAYPEARREKMLVKGRDILKGLPKGVEITTAQAAEALVVPVSKIIERIKQLLEDTPPELAADIMDRGIVLSGGGAMLYGFDEVIRHATDISTWLADDPLSCVAIGTGKALDFADQFDGKNMSIGMRRV